MEGVETDSNLALATRMLRESEFVSGSWDGTAHPPLLHEKHFELFEPVGQGASSTIWKAHDRLSNRHVAIKILAGPPDPERVLRLAQEVEILKGLEHPNIVRLFGTGVSCEGSPFVVMEWIDGISLRQRLLQSPVLPDDEVLRVVQQVCSGLVDAHMAGVVHRDIKPENVMLRFPRMVSLKVVDFGTAKRLAPGMAKLTTDGKILGTPEYISPECARGEPIQGPADVYAVAVMAYEMLCGQLPFDDPVPVKIVARHLSEPPPPMPGVHPSVEQAVLAGLSKDPQLRPSAAQFLRSFTTAVEEAWRPARH
jgi:serine/threonine-protein kinase